MTDLWYPITHHHPAPLAQVRAIVEFHGGVQGTYDAQIVISRGRPPHTNVWASWGHGKPAMLPPRARPICWQPQSPDKWQARLPPPLVSPPIGRMWSETMALSVVDEAEAAELAREMERDRADARHGARDIYPPSHNRQPVQWWRDADQIRYEPPGSVSLRMAEGRVMRAVAMCGHGTGLTVRSRLFGAVLADLSARAQAEDYATSDYVPRLRAMPADQTDFDVAMAWFTALNPQPFPKEGTRATWAFNRAQQALAFRSFNIPLSFDEIGNQWSVSGEAARQTYARALNDVCRVANGGVAGNDNVAELRQRNAAWRRADARGVA